MDFHSRIQPVFVKAEAQAAQLVALKKELDDKRAEASRSQEKARKRMDELSQQVASTRRELIQRDKTVEGAVQAAADALAQSTSKDKEHEKTVNQMKGWLTTHKEHVCNHSR